MALWNVNHVLTTEDRLTKIFNNSYETVLANAWYDKVCVERPGEGRKDQFEWLLTTAGIDVLDKGSMVYEDLLTKSHEIVHGDFGKGIKISRNQFEDDEFNFTTDMAAQLGTAVALHPQKLTLALILAGGAALSYDGVAMFSASHPVFNAAGSVYSNVHTSRALTADNFSTQCGEMQSIPLPNGESRNLKVTRLLVPPALRKAALEITSAEFLGQASGGTNQNVLTGYGVEVVVIPGLATAAGGNDASWYLTAEEAGQFGRPFIYSRRRAFEMSSFNGMTQSELSRTNELVWDYRGRAAGAYGHPYLISKATA